MRHRLILLFLIFPWLCAAEPDWNFAFHTIRHEQGLSHDGIRSIITDSRGYVWIGTQMGLNRYDGVRIRSFYRDDFGLSSNFVASLCEDHSGNIWIGTSEGLAVYDYAKDVFWTPACAEGGLEKLFITSIACTSRGEVWIIADSGDLFSFNPADGVLKRHSTSLGRGYGRLAFDSEDNLVIISSPINLFRYANGDVTAINPSNWPGLFEDDELWGPVSRTDTEGIIYVSTKKRGVFEVDLKRNTARHLLGWELDEKPTGLALVDNRTLWCTTTAGLISLDIKSGLTQRMRHSQNNPFSISEDYLSCISATSDGEIWVGTSLSGASFINRGMNRFSKHFRTDSGESLSNCVIKGFCEDESGMVWITTERLGLLKYNPGENSLERVQDPRIPQFLSSIAFDGENLWIGTQFGLIKYNPPTRTLKKYLEDSAANENRVTSIFIASDRRFYVGLLSGVRRYDSGSDSFTPVPGLENAIAESFAEDWNGNIWTATYSSGVFRLSGENDSLTSFKGQTQLMTSSAFIDRNGSVWIIGRDSEVAKYDEEAGVFRVIPATESNLLPNAILLCAQQGSGDHIWISSTSGLVDFDSAGQSVSALFDVRSGLLENTFCKASLKLRDGTCLFGSLDGFTSFPSYLSVKESREVDIDALFLGDEEIRPGGRDGVIDCNVNLADHIHIGPNQHYFSLRLSTPGAAGPVIVECQLVGHDVEPIRVSSDRPLNFYNVRPGTYTLRISGHKDVRVTVDPPFLASTLGITLMGLAFLGLIALLAYLTWKRQNARMRRSEAEFKMKQEEELVKEKMNFLSNVVHEIKTPLTLMKTPLQNLSASGSLSEPEMKDVEIIGNSADYLDKLSKELLEFIKVEEFGYVLSPEPLDLVEVTGFLCFNFSDAAKNRNLKIEFSHDEDQIFVNADEKALRKILNNLLHNALKYAGSYFAVEVERKDGKAFVKVRNDGPGIPEEKRDDIFKPFVQLGEKSSSHTQSFGIGLALARKLAALHGGSLTLSQSAETEFIFSIPLLDEPVPVPQEAVPDSNVPGNGKPVILVVEDNENLSDYLKEKLSSEFNPIAVKSAEGALNILKSVVVDLVLTDISMPGIGGIELCRRIKEKPDISGIPIIVISAIASESAKIECIENGAGMYIEKPFTIDYLVASVNSLLSKRQPELKDAEMPSFQIAVEDRDAKFLSNLNSIVERHIGDESFSVKQMEEELFMSHSSLNRKMANLLNTTPVDYIRTARLKAAAAILKEKDVNISEVGYKVGFSTPSYFSKCFKDYFGVTPAEYARGE